MPKAKVISRRAVVRTSFVGFHCWPEAQGPRAYLRHRHRHRFDVEVELATRAEDREVEFHDLLAVVEDAIAAIGGPAEGEKHSRELGRMSCEDIAERVGNLVAFKWSRYMTVRVFEDGEAGADLHFEPAG